MGLFKRRKRKLEKLEEITQRYEGGFAEEQRKTPQQVREYVEQQMKVISDEKQDYENTKKEYEIVTSYLNDIQQIESVGDEEQAVIREIATNISGLNQKRESYLNSEKRISDAQFSQFEILGEKTPDIIRAMQENEDYQSKIRKDLNILEGEKTQWQYEKKDLEREQGMIKNLSLMLLLLFVAASVVIFVLNVAFRVNTKTAFLICLALSSIGAFLLYVRRQNNADFIRQAEACINKAIRLENQIKIKYVSITDAVDYQHEKYHVRNAKEMNWQWEEYLELCKEKEKLLETNADLEYYVGLLMKALRPYALYDAKIWKNQAEALIDPKEMVEVKHSLLVRRQKLRSRMEAQYDAIERKVKEVEMLVKSNEI